MGQASHKDGRWSLSLGEMTRHEGVVLSFAHKGWMSFMELGGAR